MSLLRASALCLLLPGAVMANETEFCSEVGGLARVIMTLRQDNAPLSEMIARANADFVREMVLMAYEQTLRSSVKGKKEAADDFGNAFELACYKGGWGKE